VFECELEAEGPVSFITKDMWWDVKWKLEEMQREMPLCEEPKTNVVLRMAGEASGEVVEGGPQVLEVSKAPQWQQELIDAGRNPVQAGPGPHQLGAFSGVRGAHH